MMLLKTDGWRGPILESGFCVNQSVRRFQGSRRSRVTTHCAYDPDWAQDDANAMGGNPRVQRALVEMIQIQVSKVKVSDFVDERKEYLRNIAEDSRYEYDRIAYRAMKGLDARGSRVLRELEAGVGAIEKELRLARAELEAQSKAMEESQYWSAQSRNEGLFFKNLYTGSGNLSKSPRKDLVVSSTSGKFSTSYKQFLSGGISLVLASFVWSSGSALLTGTFMRPLKLASYGVILTLLLTQLAYVEVLTGENENQEIEVVPQDVIGGSEIKTLDGDSEIKTRKKEGQDG